MRLLVLLLLLVPGLAFASELGDALRAQAWGTADALAASAADPLAGKLVRYERLLTAGAAQAGEIDAFMTASPQWPQQGLLARRYAEALAAERDDAAVRLLCGKRMPATAPALLRCAEAQMRGGGDAAPAARQAWLVGVRDPAAEALFMGRWANAIDAETQWRRFELLAWTESAAPGGTLARQAVRVAPAARPASEARLALRRDDAGADALFAALPDSAKADPGLVLDLASWYRRAHRDADSVRVWQTRGVQAERDAPEEHQRAFWNERSVLARQLLRAQQLEQDRLAFAVADMPTAAAAARSDAAFLAGWIALRRLAQPEAAAAQFVAVAQSGSAISQGRAHYWLGRALAAAGKTADAEAEYRRAAAWPTTYYGQLAALALGEGMAGLRARIEAASDPGWSEQRALDVAGSEFGRAATLLAWWGEARRAKPFLAALDDAAREPGERAIVARLGIGLGLPEVAVAAARQAGRDGAMLPQIGWPAAADPPPGRVERAVALGLIRQESSFDRLAGSPSGAQGLMQLMPGTAADEARKLGAASGPLTDPAINLRLGTAYLAALLDRFGALPPALAAYNAGPGRAREWIAAFGDPAAGAIDPIDWIELIPFGETRDYVQRVVENVVIYRVRSGTELAHPVLRWAGDGT